MDYEPYVDPKYRKVLKALSRLVDVAIKAEGGLIIILTDEGNINFTATLERNEVISTLEQIIEELKGELPHGHS